MKLPVRYGKCVWCIRPLKTSVADADDSRSEEHVFPRNIFGVVVTRDCCKDCNSRLGSMVDVKLPADERIILAAREAGIKESELLSRFSGAGLDSPHQTARYTVKDGEWRRQPDFRSPQGFKIGMIDGKVFEIDLKNAKAKMRSIVEKDKSLQLTREQIAECVDDLFDDYLASLEHKPVYCRKIKQGLTSSRGPTHVKLDGCYRPYETEWAIAKLLYETAIVLLSPDMFAKVWTALDSLRMFVEQRKAGASIFSYESVARTAQRWHEVNVGVTGNSLSFAVTLFGKETWKQSFSVLENGSPAKLEALDLTLRNDFPSADKKSARVLLNGQEWMPEGAIRTET